ncbi:DNA repair protein RadC [Pseudomonas aeruginosa]|uniref:JAB domain-containing protein n=1 Tax=Pseudomonas aeruginosa TaxID=287 RepID=UPI00053CF29B|nr:JAB domain-containing protein [Pseudomonas aeruginosa]WCV81023.1 DNA repair protein RadC [Pseudomonas aeruginosa]HBO0859744.1 DNA repair protein RadC [Pseudomonas aeruginosa]HCE6879296.1 DNA repair protein RadC [Pseudomonas aeruginosa]HDR2971102.1 DNA repair protein RadC [Pseudomonas aeruginosa]
MSTVRSGTNAPISSPESPLLSSTEDDDRIIEQAFAILERRFFATGPTLTCPQAVGDYLRLKLISEPNEVFVAVFFNSLHQVIAFETLFKGTIDTAEVHPRVVVQRALAHNAAALIVGHLHPSGSTQPSAADHALTARLKSALSLMDIRLLDHIIVGKGPPLSLALKGFL